MPELTERPRTAPALAGKAVATPHELLNALVAMAADGLTVHQAAKRIGANNIQVGIVAGLLGIQFRDPVAAYKAGIMAGKSRSQIAVENGVSATAVLYALRRKGLPTCAREVLRQQCAQA